MNLERYQRQTALAGFGLAAQQKLHQAKVLVVGAGGLGVPVLTYLNAMGVGTLGIVERDTVSLSNLQRQVLYSEADVNRPKLASALKKLRAQNSETVFKTYETFLTRENAMRILAGYDAVVDATDNFPTRYLINDACVILRKPMVYGALHGFEGQVSVLNFEGGPTYRCLFPNMPKFNEVPDCNENGVLGILPGIIGNLQALETVKLLTGVGEVLSGKLLLFDAFSNGLRKIRFAARPENLKIDTLRPSYDLDCGTGIKSMDAETFLNLEEFDRRQLIDVRTPKEFERNHLQIANNIPISELENRQDEIHFDEKIYVVCQSGIRSKKAIERLLDMCPDADFTNISGGMNKIKKHALTH